MSDGGPATSRRSFLGRAAAGAAGSTLMTPSARAAAAQVDPMIADVRHFGAVGDGRTDDTASIQAAVRSLGAGSGAPGGCVWFPPGDYVISDTIVVDFATTLAGANPAASTLRMDSRVLKDLIAGGSSFPVYINLTDMSFDGGLQSQSREHVPAGTGTVHVANARRPGTFADAIRVASATVPLGHGDLLRAADQPVIVVNDDDPPALMGESMSVCNWTPYRPVSNDLEWQVFSAGDLITGCARVSIDNCHLKAAKRHAINLRSSTQGNISRSEVGGNQGCGLFASGSSDFAVSDSWFYGCGGPHVYLAGAVDIRIHHSFFEGSGSYNLYADWSEIEIDHCGLWGGRGGLVYSRNSAMMRLAGLKLRQPGYGAHDASALWSSGYQPLRGRPCVDVHFSHTDFGVQAVQCTLHEALPGTGPMFRLANGGRSNLSTIEWNGSVEFDGGNRAGMILRDGGDGTIVRSFRGVPDAG